MENRKPDSHKGDNGKVLIVGGSTMFHGAPLLCSLGAEFSGADLIFPYIPKEHVEAAKTHSLNFIIQTFEDPMLTSKDVKNILHFSQKVDVVVIGPGLGSDAKTQTAVKKLLANLKVPTVVDASALIYTNSYPKETLLTPHRGEFKALTGDDPTTKNVQKWAKSLGVTIACKGPEDIIANSDQLTLNKTGTPQMTVGGSGDVLSGLIGGLIAQGYDLFEAAQIGTKTLGETGELLSQRQETFRAIDIAKEIPFILND